MDEGEVDSNCETGFTLVKYKRRLKYKKKNVLGNGNINDECSYDNIGDIMRRFRESQLLIRNSEQLNYFVNAINKSITLLNANKEVGNNFIKDIVCYGIGKFSGSHQAMHQLALLIQFKHLYNTPVHIFDPVLSQTEREILMNLGLNIISYNEEGKRKVDVVTLFFLPHCPRELLNNILFTNWGHSLCKCIIISNSHCRIITDSPSSALHNYKYITEITPAIQQIHIPNIYRLTDVFNDMAVHYFPIEELETVSDDVWRYNEHPVYSKHYSEFIDCVRANRPLEQPPS
ncbi:hypothetical protein O3M35_012561 [Rhynocoris fuscipes]|uniref:SRR1-like domain-containing protein n=1 Tax=Rhynocoris fuscipes TaxID=488301 RepID=A0AAW1CWA1_9HEMI